MKVVAIIPGSYGSEKMLVEMRAWKSGPWEGVAPLVVNGSAIGWWEEKVIV